MKTTLRLSALTMLFSAAVCGFSRIKAVEEPRPYRRDDKTAVYRVEEARAVFHDLGKCVVILYAEISDPSYSDEDDARAIEYLRSAGLLVAGKSDLEALRSSPTLEIHWHMLGKSNIYWKQARSEITVTLSEAATINRTHTAADSAVSFSDHWYFSRSVKSSEREEIGYVVRWIADRYKEANPS